MKIIVDTREKHPWTFESCTGIEIAYNKLDTGDYALEGYLDKCCIERKETVSELAGNITKQRFWNEMNRMKVFKWKFLVLEFGLQHIIDFPDNLSLKPSIRKKIQIRGPFIIRELTRIQTEYDIHVLYCHHRIYAEKQVISIFKRVLGQ